jgi:hypothetical protein
MDKFRKRLFALYLGGVINAYAGLFLLIEGLPVLSPQTSLWIGIAFLVFAAVDFAFPVYLRAQALARAAAQSRE